LFLVAFGLLVYAHQFAVLRKTSLLTDNLPTLKRTPFTSPAANPASLTVVNATLPTLKSTPPTSPPACAPVMTPAQFRLDTEVFGCCTVGVPLDQTMKNFLTKICGFFIESGVQDGIFQSNTLIFARKFGYSGLLVEPATSLIRALAQNRPESIVFNGALTSFVKDGSHVTVPSGSPMGIVSHNTTHAQSTVIARSLSSLLDEHGIENVDFLSLDVEGHETDILDGIDFHRHRTTFILIEIWKKNPQTFQVMRSACYTLYSEHVDHEGSISMWQHATAHRDFLFVDRHSGNCHTAPVYTHTTPVKL
jgi:FkbM family methyltransferase